MLDVLLYLFEHYMDEGHDVPHDEAILKDVLKDAGFPQAEINKAFLWLEDLVEQRGDAEPGAAVQRSSFRIYTAQELGRINGECRGFLLTLEQCGIVTSQTREIILERAMALDLDDIDLDKFRLIVMMVLANQTGNEDLQEWIETLVFDISSDRLH
jgi:Smg protein